MSGYVKRFALSYDSYLENELLSKSKGKPLDKLKLKIFLEYNTECYVYYYFDISI